MVQSTPQRTRNRFASRISGTLNSSSERTSGCRWSVGEPVDASSTRSRAASRASAACRSRSWGMEESTLMTSASTGSPIRMRPGVDDRAAPRSRESGREEVVARKWSRGRESRGRTLAARPVPEDLRAVGDVDPKPVGPAPALAGPGTPIRAISAGCGRGPHGDREGLHDDRARPPDRLARVTEGR